MKVVSLCSGSKGNSTFLEINGKKILIDTGKTYKYIKETLSEIEILIEDIDYILITHNHVDHTSALNVIMKYHSPTLIIPETLYKSLKDIRVDENLIFIENEKICIDGITIKALKSSHDAPDSRYYVIEYEKEKFSLLTDTGYIKTRHFKDIYNSTIIFMESNHDIEMLQRSSYKDYLKKRIYSDSGHLCNRQAGVYLSKLIGPKTQIIKLIHLSEENNTEQKALNDVGEILKENDIVFNNISICKQNEISEVITID